MDHLEYLKHALQISHSSPPLPTNFRVGAIIVSNPSSSHTSKPASSILSTGYTLELPGNTHAEQCALSKLATAHSVPESELSKILTAELNAILYTTLEPCGKRLSANKSCVQRIVETRRRADGQDIGCGIRKVVFGAKEPGTFVQDSQSCKMLDDAGVEWEYVEGLEKEILEVAKAGHVTEEKPVEAKEEQVPQGTNVDDISAEERKRQEELPRNPKKRMMEVPPGNG